MSLCDTVDGVQCITLARAVRYADSYNINNQGIRGVSHSTVGDGDSSVVRAPDL